jgi:hypothetical protein
VISFNEFAYNNSTMYNFKVDEETFNKLVNSSLKVQLEGLSVIGQVAMIKLLMAKGYKYEATINLERMVRMGEEVPSVNTLNANNAKGKDSKK